MQDRSTQRRYNKQCDGIGLEASAKEWQWKGPWDFIGCLAHLDITYCTLDYTVQQMTGVLPHNEACCQQNMKCLPAVPLHDHIWQVTLQQLNDGASYVMAAIQACNLELFWGKLYNGQKTLNPQTANVCHEFLPSDSTWLYWKLSQLHGLDMEWPVQYNIDNWLNPKSATYKQELVAAIFHYQARAEQDDCLCVCIQIADMKEASWKYAHHRAAHTGGTEEFYQVILDGTFGVCKSRMLLFIALGVNENGKGVPLAMFLFSAPTGNKATQAGYDFNILYQLLKEWRDSLGFQNSEAFRPLVPITDTDTKEHGTLNLIWPDI
ncbi:hypothetical protein K439DRAFT_1335462 [Ramaria rubella]|nr:hypothetical protein K439DRAFT_1335462 [Ramaria rubella]